MANPNDITRRSDKDTFLTFEEMDLNLDVLKDLVIDYNNIYNTILPGLTDRVGDVEQDLSDYKVEVNTRFNGVVSTIEENTFTREQIFADNVQMTSANISTLSVNTTFRLPRWKNNTRPNNPLYGVFGYNTDLNNLEFFDGNNWNTLHDPTATENEAKAGSSVSFRRWSPKLIRDAIIGWWESITNTYSRGMMSQDTASKMRTHLGLKTVASSGSYNDLDNKPSLGTAATKDVGTGNGNVITQNEYGIRVKKPSKEIADLNATNSSSNAWNDRDNSSLFLENNNNALSVFISSKQNERITYIQSGHSDVNYANAYGTISLNPFGGNVTVNGYSVYHAGNPPPVTWESISSKPATATRWPSWGEVSGKPGIPPYNQSIGAGGVGQYAFVQGDKNLYMSVNWGGTVAGSSLIRTSSPVVIAGISGNLAGTWRILGDKMSRGIATLAIRIS